MSQYHGGQCGFPEMIELLTRKEKMQKSMCRAGVARMRMLLPLVFLVIIMSNLEGIDAIDSNGTCDFPFENHRPTKAITELEGCFPPASGMRQCLEFLDKPDEKALQPTNTCCAGVAMTWKLHPACLCMITLYPDPFSINTSSISSETGRNLFPNRGHELFNLCNLTGESCSKCPALLGLLSGPVSEKKPQRTVPLVAVILVCLLSFVALVLSLLVWRKRVRSRFQPIQDILRIEGRPTLFEYNVLKVATRSFHISSKLGEGGFGAVYKGVLQDGSEVAVKQLSTKSMQGNDEFLNEVTLITRVQHRNLVKLRGCCIKGPERLLVYEYLENKSLHQALFDTGERLHLNWPARVKILVGIARGLAYLHEGCQTRIVHRDIKSSNILLDKDLNPKIADFGLARLFTDNQSHVSTRVAGTVGYLSPEYAMRGQLTEKADVFSFGIVALELISGRTNFNAYLPPEEASLLDWTWKLHAEGKVVALLDPVVMGSPCPEDEVIRAIEIALLCTQSLASMRPSMSRVVSMLAGESEVETSNIVKPSIYVFKSSSQKSASRQDVLSICYSQSSSDQSRKYSSVTDPISIVNPR